MVVVVGALVVVVVVRTLVVVVVARAIVVVVTGATAGMVVVSAVVVACGAVVGSEPAACEQAARISASPMVRKYFINMYRQKSRESDPGRSHAPTQKIVGGSITSVRGRSTRGLTLGSKAF